MSTISQTRSSTLRSTAIVALGLAVAACSATRAASTGRRVAVANSADASPAVTDAALSSVGNTASSTTGFVPVRRPIPTVAPSADPVLPAAIRTRLANGIELNSVSAPTLPMVHFRLLVRGAGHAADPVDRPGLATFVGDMLREGTTTRTSEQLADAIDTLGARLEVATDADATSITMSVLSEFASEGVAIVCEMVSRPAFAPAEIDRLRRREIVRLARERSDPSWLARRAFLRAVYGRHPYNHFEPTVPSLHGMQRPEISAFHRRRYVGGSMHAFLVGAVDAPIRAAVERALAAVPAGRMPAIASATPPTPSARTIVLIDRPGSDQSVVRVGAVAVARNATEYVPLSVASQVLGGGPSSRLFVDLRERRALTYGAYSRVSENVEAGTFQATIAVRTPATIEALRALLEHLDRLAASAPEADELTEARRFLTDSFALGIDTIDDIARTLAIMRTHGFADDYWSNWRAQIRAVTPEQALAAAQRFAATTRACIVVVGDATAVSAGLREFGDVEVQNLDGAVVRRLARTSGG